MSIIVLNGPLHEGDVVMVQGDVRVPCMAKPGVVKHGWRTDTDCASKTDKALCHAGLIMPLCEMHLAMWARSSPERRQELIRRWEW